MKKFEIIASSVSFEDRPPISYKVWEYLETFITDNVFIKKKIIINGNWNIYLVLAFLPETKRYQSDYLYMSDKPVTANEEKVKTYEVLVPMKLIKHADQPYITTIQLIYEALTLFLTRTYKKVLAEEMAELWKSVDINYLLSLPFPAPLIDQKYLTDVVTPEGTVTSFWATAQTTTYEGRTNNNAD